MRVTRLIPNEETLNKLFDAIKKIDKQMFLLCLLSAYTGARFSELKLLNVQDLNKKHIRLGGDYYKEGGRNAFIRPELKPTFQRYMKHCTSPQSALLEREGAANITFVEVNQVVAKAARKLKLEDITFMSFRKTFGHRLYKTMRSSKVTKTELKMILSFMGYKPRIDVKWNAVFETAHSEWRKGK